MNCLKGKSHLRILRTNEQTELDDPKAKIHRLGLGKMSPRCCGRRR